MVDDDMESISLNDFNFLNDFLFWVNDFFIFGFGFYNLSSFFFVI
jgi:hypothetical protein